MLERVTDKPADYQPICLSAYGSGEVAKSFEELKRKSGVAEIERLQRAVRFSIKEHRTTKLEKALGDIADKTLLDVSVSRQHKKRLAEIFAGKWKGMKWRAVANRLRFMTVLHEVVALELDNVTDSVNGFIAKLNDTLKDMAGIEVIGAIEIEILNFDYLSKAERNAENARKFQVVKEMRAAGYAEPFHRMSEGETCFALIHGHFIVDLGKRAEEAKKSAELAKALRKIWTVKWQVELKAFSSDKLLSKSLVDIAGYLTKGGNEELRYKANFGRDTADELDAAVIKAGNLGADFEGQEDDRSLSVYELKLLGQAMWWLMNRTGSNWRNGYIYRHGRVWNG
jgi:hypothetical protein